MRTTSFLQSANNKAFVALLLGGTVVSFHELFFGSLRAEALEPFLSLVLGAATLAAAGWALASLGGIRIAYGNSALQIGIGQIALIVWLYLRSAINFASQQLADVAAPVTRAELVLMIVALIWLAHRKRRIQTTLRLVPGFLWIVIALFIISQRDLPREVMPSSDPDQHLFFATQILKLGAIPFQLAEWGPLDFQYPAGYAAICAVWSWLGFSTSANVVMIQPLLQTILALFAIASIAAERLVASDLRLDLAVGYFVLTIFFGVFPFTLTHDSFYLEKTGSISSLLLLVTTFSLIAEVSWGANIRSKLAAHALSGAGVGLSALVNPLALVVPGIAYTAGFLKQIWRQNRSALGILGIALIYLAVPLAIVLADPYYIARFFATRPFGAPPVSTNFVVPTFNFFGDALYRFLELLRTFDWVRPFLLLPFFGRFFVSIVVIPATIALLLWLLPRERRQSVLRLIAVGPLLAVGFELIALPIAYALRSKGDLYLLEPYLIAALARFAYVWYLGILFCLTVVAFGKASAYKRGPTIFVLIFTLFMIPIRSVRDRLPNEVDMRNRLDDCGMLGCLHDDDRVVLQTLSENYKNYDPKDGAGTPRTLPKVLIANAPLEFGRERWIMPTGAARSIATKTDVPAAFFYYKGSVDYSYENYMEHVCNKLDIEWLRERNIKFLFLPTERKNVCVADLDSLLNGKNVIHQSGRSLLLKLFD